MMKLRAHFIFLMVIAAIFSSCTHRTITPLYREPRPVTIRPLLPAAPIAKKREIIVLDAGHGGKDTGTKSQKYHYEEKELTLRTTQLVKGFLENMGYPVILTRNSDVYLSLEERAEMANTTSAALFVSMHYNTCPNSEAEGIEIYYYKEENNPKSDRILESKQLGEEVMKTIVTHTGAASRGVRKANFAVVREAKMPAILIEGGFLSNPKEREKIKDQEYLRYYAWGIARGIDYYLTKK